jgi:hypothetical protein
MNIPFKFYEKYFSLIMTFYRLKHVAFNDTCLVLLTVYINNNDTIAQPDV